MMRNNMCRILYDLDQVRLVLLANWKPKFRISVCSTDGGLMVYCHGCKKLCICTFLHSCYCDMVPGGCKLLKSSSMLGSMHRLSGELSIRRHKGTP